MGALDAIGERMFDISVKPLFERAIDNRDATIWICENDALAMRALSFLRERGIRVPDDLSVVGFDNVPIEALENRLTTIDFNSIEVIRRMLNFVLRPPRPRGPYRHLPIEIEGIVMERGTAGKAIR